MKIQLYHPNNPRYIVIPRDMRHAINLMANGWIRVQATVTKAGEAKS